MLDLDSTPRFFRGDDAFTFLGSEGPVVPSSSDDIFPKSITLDLLADILSPVLTDVNYIYVKDAIPPCSCGQVLFPHVCSGLDTLETITL